MSSRESGIVLHITSLPSPYGMGDLGPAAEAFAEALVQAGQKIWQVLPLGPTTYGDSPYQSLSTFAGNTLLLSLERLQQAGLLDQQDLDDHPKLAPGTIDYGHVIHLREGLFAKVCENFKQRASAQMRTNFAQFIEEQAAWLDDFALFLALKNQEGGKPWTLWEPALAQREPSRLANVRLELAHAMDDVRILQFLFAQQWNALRACCNAKGIRIMGDIPIFVAHDSADVWANPELFYLDEAGNPTVVAGVPPDYFSETGQLWGNPLYRWDLMQERGYAWWLRRLARTFEWVDILRIDHFRGFESYWEVHAGETTAMNGKWVPGPGLKVFEAFRAAHGEQPIVAEDLGIITEEVEALLKASGFPGMKVLHFSFGEESSSEEQNQPQHFPANSVCYTGTHDNDTTVGWFRALKANPETGEECQRVLDYLGSDGQEIHWDFIRTALNSGSNIALFPLQDVLGLDSASRLNFPGKTGGNWQWRFQWDQLNPEMIQRLRDLTHSSGRCLPQQ